MKFDTKVVLGKELLGFFKLEHPYFPERSKRLFLRSLKDAAYWLGGGNDILKAPYINPHYSPKLAFTQNMTWGRRYDFSIHLQIKRPNLSALYAIRLNIYVNALAGCIDHYSLSVQFWKEGPWQELTDLKSREDIFRFLRGYSTQYMQ